MRDAVAGADAQDRLPHWPPRQVPECRRSLRGGGQYPADRECQRRDEHRAGDQGLDTGWTGQSYATRLEHCDFMAVGDDPLQTKLSVPFNVASHDPDRQ